MLIEKRWSNTKILKELCKSGKELIKVGTSMPVHDAITYLEHHKNRTNYAKAYEEGLSIGSGNVEATCKSLIEVRMKRCGMRWKDKKQKPEGGPKGFVAIKKRWVVERSFGWMNLCRQLSKEYDQLAEVSEAWCDLATIYMLLRRRSGRSVVWKSL
jgi:hypothetical protein